MLLGEEGDKSESAGERRPFAGAGGDDGTAATVAVVVPSLPPPAFPATSVSTRDIRMWLRGEKFPVKLHLLLPPKLALGWLIPPLLQLLLPLPLPLPPPPPPPLETAGELPPPPPLLPPALFLPLMLDLCPKPNPPPAFVPPGLPAVGEGGLVAGLKLLLLVPGSSSPPKAVTAVEAFSWDEVYAAPE